MKIMNTPIISENFLVPLCNLCLPSPSPGSHYYSVTELVCIF